jgi:ABC-type spermidine/putrescine transport system permease subunit I
MKRFLLFLPAMLGATQASAMAHNGAPPGASLVQIALLEIECMLTTTWFALQLLLTGQWFALANLDGICTTAVNSIFFTSLWTAVATTLVMAILTLILAFLALRWLMRDINTASHSPGLGEA